MPENNFRRLIQRSQLANGVKLVSEKMDRLRSVAVGVWIGQGSRHESDAESGVAHFIEHMVFKGTPAHSARDVARMVDSFGGHIDAFTTKECVCFNTKVLDEQFDTAFDVLADLVLDPAFRPEDIEREKRVVLEEIRMEGDSPEHEVFNLFARRFWLNQPLGRTILGTEDHVRAFNLPMIRGFYERAYVPGNMVIAAAGNITHEQLTEAVERRFGKLPQRVVTAPAEHTETHSLVEFRHWESLQQVHLCIGFPSVPFAHPDRYASYVLNAILGGGLSSRLFQNVREQKGLAYNLFSELSPYRDSGCLSIYAATTTSALNALIEAILHELTSLKRDTVLQSELDRARRYLKSSLMLGLESTSSRMSHIARQELFLGHPIGLDEMLRRVDSVTSDDICRLSNAIFQTDALGIAAVGNLEEADLRSSTLAV